MGYVFTPLVTDVMSSIYSNEKYTMYISAFENISILNSILSSNTDIFGNVYFNFDDLEEDLVECIIAYEDEYNIAVDIDNTIFRYVMLYLNSVGIYFDTDVEIKFSYLANIIETLTTILTVEDSFIEDKLDELTVSLEKDIESELAELVYTYTSMSYTTLLEIIEDVDDNLFKYMSKYLYNRFKVLTNKSDPKIIDLINQLISIHTDYTNTCLMDYIYKHGYRSLTFKQYLEILLEYFSSSKFLSSTHNLEELAREISLGLWLGNETRGKVVNLDDYNLNLLWVDDIIDKIDGMAASLKLIDLIKEYHNVLNIRMRYDQ